MSKLKVTTTAPEPLEEYFSSLNSLATPKLLFDCARRTPEYPPRIDPIWIELQHLVVELLRSCRHFCYPVEIAYILPGLLDDPGIVVVTRSLMCGDNCAWVKRLNFVECRDPLATTL